MLCDWQIYCSDPLTFVVVQTFPQKGAFIYDGVCVVYNYIELGVDAGWFKIKSLDYGFLFQQSKELSLDCRRTFMYKTGGYVICFAKLNRN